MSTYAEALTIRDARAQHFSENGFDEGIMRTAYATLRHSPDKEAGNDTASAFLYFHAQGCAAGV